MADGRFVLLPWEDGGSPTLSRGESKVLLRSRDVNRIIHGRGWRRVSRFLVIFISF